MPVPRIAPTRWILVLLGLASLGGLAGWLGSSDVRVEHAHARGSPGACAPEIASSPSIPVPPTRPERQPASSPTAREDGGRNARRAEVESATMALARSLESPDYEESLWRSAIARTAEYLGDDALPELRAVLADDERSVEEHVAASELVARLEER
jgi:hypothetical protein